MVWCSFSKIHSNFHLCNNQQLWHHNRNVLFYLRADKGIITQSYSQHLADLTFISFLHCILILWTWVNVLCFTFVIWKKSYLKTTNKLKITSKVTQEMKVSPLSSTPELWSLNHPPSFCRVMSHHTKYISITESSDNYAK